MQLPVVLEGGFDVFDVDVDSFYFIAEDKRLFLTGLKIILGGFSILPNFSVEVFDHVSEVGPQTVYIIVL